MPKQTYTLPAPWTHAINGWLEWLAAGGASVETVRVRRGVLRSVARRTDSPGPQSLTTDTLIRLFAAHRWSNDHRRNVRTTLTLFYGWCQHAGITADNPAEGLPRMPEGKPKPKPVTDSVWQELLAAAGPRERLMARLAAEAGMRRAEVAQAHRDDLIDDLVGSSLIVHGKGGKQRIVPITDSLADAIRAYRCIDYTPRGFLFPGQIDGHISPNRVGVLISSLMPPGWSMHKLRHRYASRGYAGTRDIRAVQLALGHASVATTQRYTAVADREVRAVSEAAA